MSLELQQFLALSSHQPLDGNARPACDHIGNVTGLHLLAQERRALGLGFRKRLFQILTPLLHPMQLVIFQPGSLFKITTALGFGHRMAQVFIVLKQLTQFGQLITLRLPAFTQLFQACGGLESLPLQLDPLRLRRLFCSKQRQFHTTQLRFGVLDHLRLGGHIHLQLCRGLVDQINRLVRQAAITDVAIGQTNRCQHRLIGDGHAVMKFVALLQSAQDLPTEFEGRLEDRHLLETTIQRRILLHRAAVVLGGRGRDAAQISLGQGRFEQAAGIRTGAIAAHHRVQFIDEQHHPFTALIAGGDLLQHAAQALFKLTAVFGTSDQGAEIQRDQAAAFEGIGHFTGHHPLG